MPISLMKGAALPVLKETYRQWTQDKVPQLAASLAYFTVFSLPPLLLVVVTIAGTVFDREVASKHLLDEVGGMLGEKGTELFADMLTNSQNSQTGAVAALATLIALVGAAGAFVQLQNALNAVWGVQAKPGLGIKGFIKHRLLSFTLVGATGFLLLVSLVISAGLAAFGAWVESATSGSGIVLSIVNFVVGLVVITVLFAAVFKFIPDAVVQWRDVWFGAVLTALLFNIGKALIGVYLGHSSAATVYGTAGSVIVLLVWVFYSAQILLFGAEFTQVYATRYGKGIIPRENAVEIDCDRKGVTKTNSEGQN